MTNKQFSQLIQQFRRDQDKLIKFKGHDYTIGGNQDRLFNFKWVAKVLGISPLQVLSVYWLKHVLAILTYIKTRGVKSESVLSRFLDENNYNLLGYALIRDILKLKGSQLCQKKRKKSKKKKPSK